MTVISDRNPVYDGHRSLPTGLPEEWLVGTRACRRQAARPSLTPPTHRLGGASNLEENSGRRQDDKG